jgi:hypothetical protein
MIIERYYYYTYASVITHIAAIDSLRQYFDTILIRQLSPLIN